MPTDKELIRYLVYYKLCIKCLRLLDSLEMEMGFL